MYFIFLQSRSSREREEELQAERLSKLKLELVTAESEVVKYRAAMECRENKLKRQTEQITSLERKVLYFFNLYLSVLRGFTLYFYIPKTVCSDSQIKEYFSRGGAIIANTGTK